MAEQLKNIFYTPESLGRLADALVTATPAFDRNLFFRQTYAGDWDRLELKDRMHRVAHSLKDSLHLPYPASLSVFKEVIPVIRGFEALCFPDYVEMYGQDDWDHSFPALEFFTRFGSSEFAVRPFLHRDPPRALAYFSRWTLDDNEHVRRLASEGCRPRLPWAMALPKFKADPAPILPILEALKDDESEYVRRSVANNLNDISKDHPDLVLAVCTRWFGSSPRTDEIVRHALRSLLKKGDPRALALFGVHESGHLAVVDLELGHAVMPIGGTLEFGFGLVVDGVAPSRARLEFVIYFCKATPGHSRKVYKIAEKVFVPGRHEFTRRFSLQDRTTRRHYPGEHFLAVVVNGEEKARSAFQLVS